MEDFRHKKGLRGQKSLTAVWRRLRLTTALTVSMTALGALAGAPQVSAQTPARTEQAQNEIQIPVQVLTPAPDTVLTPEQREDAIRKILLADARTHYAQYAPLAKTEYSKELAQLQTRMSAYMARHNANALKRAAPLDPAQFDVGLAFGMTTGQTISAMLKAQHVTPGKNTVEEAVDGMFNMTALPYSNAADYTQEPHALIDPDEPDMTACAIVPSSDYLLPYHIDGLTTDTTVTFVNRHEFWHCMDDRYVMSKGMAERQKSISMKTPADFRKLLARPDLLSDMAVIGRKEALADAGALGDLIREGADPAIIDKVIAWRSSQPGDATHYSPPVLRALKAKIADMGLAKFRKLDDGAAKNLYYKLTDAHGLSMRARG
ncbi:MAG: hypothetical protein GC185_08840 [Alphaproteobacteria bacterium]|nr:hypothetical protein [Alphaproteobacteria bacterium]